jgi:hypothetical protein
MLVSAANLPAAASQPSLADRVTYVYNLNIERMPLTSIRQPRKDKPKPATAAKAAPAAAGKGRGGKAEARGGRGGRNPRERTKKKTTTSLPRMETQTPLPLVAQMLLRLQQLLATLPWTTRCYKRSHFPIASIPSPRYFVQVQRLSTAQTDPSLIFCALAWERLYSLQPLRITSLARCW